MVATLARLSARLQHPVLIDLGIAVFLTAGAVLWRRARPGAVVLAVLAPWSALHFVQSSSGPDSDPAFPIFAVLVASYSLGAFARPRVGVAGLVFAMGYFAIGGALSGGTPPTNNPLFS